MIAGRRTMSGRNRMCCWISGAEPEHAHDLGDPGAGDPFPPGYLGLICGLAGLQERLPLDGLAQEFDDPGCLGIFGRLRLAAAWRDGAHDPGGGYTARQGADVAVFEGPFGPEGYLDSLFPVAGVLSIHCYMDDPEPDFRFADTGPVVSRPGHLGSQSFQ